MTKNFGRTKKMKTVPGYAKINLHLDIKGIMNDGYHSVNTVMQSLSLCDEVTVSLVQEPVFDAECNLEGVPTDEKNIAVRAAIRYFETVGADGGAHIVIDKHIPMAAGLAGGSADAAATLVALDSLFGERLGRDKLCELGAKLGADVPFCIACGTHFSDGRGDMLHSFPKLDDSLIFVVACGGEGVSTPWGYRLLDETFDRFVGYTPKDTKALKTAIESGDKYAFTKHIFNIFESPVLKERPVAAEIKRIMQSRGAICAMMSGSGPSVFGVFEDEQIASKTAEEIRALGYFADVARPIGERYTRCCVK